MTTEEDSPGDRDMDRLNRNIAKMEQLSQRLVTALGQQQSPNAALQAPSQELFTKASSAYLAEMMNNPSKVLENQVSYWGKALKHFVEAQHLIASGKLAAASDTTGTDRRFSNPLWETHPYFNFIKQQYMLTAEAVDQAVAGLDHLDARDKNRVGFFSRQIMDLMAPSNFLVTNPAALERAVETDGASLLQGMENLVRDVEANSGGLVVTLADKDAFSVGGNIATAEGSVVFRNRMFELIQYTPTTEKVHKTPLIIFPPWINKFYILDLKPQNSMIRWIVDQGFTLFVVSWVNPDASFRDVGLEDYIEGGYLTAINEVKAITGEDKVNAVGYCIAGTMLALTLSLMSKRADTSIKSATFFTTLTDFSDQGEVGVFLEDDFLDGIEAEVTEKGYLSSFFVARTFSFLRSNDLIYGPAIRSYMMGEAPPAFDLLFWNGDGANLPAKMAIEYLRGLCQDDCFAQGGFELFGETLSIKDVKVPLCAIACETDHIAAWRSSFNGVKQMQSRNKTFILSESGHIAGIVNPPSRNKYGHYTSDGPLDDPDTWRAGAERTDGSWWPVWGAWLAKRSGAKVAARVPGTPSHPVLAPAPGTYVTALPKV